MIAFHQIWVLSLFEVTQQCLAVHSQITRHVIRGQICRPSLSGKTDSAYLLITRSLPMRCRWFVTHRQDNKRMSLITQCRIYIPRIAMKFLACAKVKYWCADSTDFWYEGWQTIRLRLCLLLSGSLSCGSGASWGHVTDLLWVVRVQNLDQNMFKIGPGCGHIKSFNLNLIMIVYKFWSLTLLVLSCLSFAAATL